MTCLPWRPAPGARFASTPAGRLLLAATIVLGAACTDGYPKDDEPILSPFEMDQSQLIDAMNQVGKNAFGGFNWDYDLKDGCVLAVSTQAEGKPRNLDVPLLGRIVDLQSRPDSEAYEVSLLPGPGAPDIASLLETGSRMDAMRMRLLTQGMQIDCNGGGSGRFD